MLSTMLLSFILSVVKQIAVILTVVAPNKNGVKKLLSGFCCFVWVGHNCFLNLNVAQRLVSTRINFFFGCNQRLEVIR